MFELHSAVLKAQQAAHNALMEISKQIHAEIVEIVGHEPDLSKYKWVVQQGKPGMILECEGVPKLWIGDVETSITGNIFTAKQDFKRL